MDPVSGKIIPTRNYKKMSQSVDVSPVKPGPVAMTKYQRSFFGASYLFDQIGNPLGITADLKSCFSNDYKKIQSIAYYLILEENNSMSRFSHWQKLHIHPYGEGIEKEYWVFDTTSISSYSETLNQVKKGRNKEKKVRIVLDRGFNSKKNVNLLYKSHQKFLVGVKPGLN